MNVNMNVCRKHHWWKIKIHVYEYYVIIPISVIIRLNPHSDKVICQYEKDIFLWSSDVAFTNTFKAYFQYF